MYAACRKVDGKDLIVCQVGRRWREEDENGVEMMFVYLGVRKRKVNTVILNEVVTEFGMNRLINWLDDHYNC